MFKREKHEIYNLSREEQSSRLREIAAVFLKLGSIAFGGPAAHVAMMEDELVKKRNWMSRESFLDLYGATNLLPGPNSTELAIYIGYYRGGARGLMLAGTAFILPAMTIVLILAAIYSRFGQLPELRSIMYGVQPVIIAIVLQALFRLGKTAINGIAPGFVVALVILLNFLGVQELPLLALGGILMMVVNNWTRIIGSMSSSGKSRIRAFIPMLPLLTAMPIKTASKGISLPGIFFTFLRIGSVLYGSGYVLLAFLESEFVHRLGVITPAQLLDSVSVGQFTPGPVFTTATFIGYLMGGVSGGILATIGIFLPAFLLVWLIHPVVPKLRKSTWVAGMLDGVNAASLGLMAVVTYKLAMAALIDPLSLGIAIVALLLVIKSKINTAWIVAVGGIIGFIAM